MTREAINLSMSEPLRRAQIRQRLDVLAKITGLAQAQLAGRALTIGLGHIERDLSQIFPGVADKPSPTEPSSPAPSMGGSSEAHPGAATQRMEAQHRAPSSTPEPEPAPPPLAAHGAPLPRDEKPDPEPQRPEPQHPEPQHPEPQHPESTKPLSAQDAARALGYGTKAAFLQHVHRHPELKRCGRKSGRSTGWDLGKLRAEYERKGWAPR